MLPIIRKDAVENDFHSLPDYFHFKFGKRASILATLTNILALGALLLIQFVVGGLMISSLLKIDLWICIVIMAIICCVYLYASGFVGILATDVLQTLVMFIALIILVITFTNIEKPTTLPTETMMPPLMELIALFLLGMFAVMGGAMFGKGYLLRKLL